MTIHANALLVEQAKLVQGLAPVVPSSSTPDYVSLRNHDRLTAIIHIKNATTVTGSAITVKQATDVSGAGEKAVSFTKAYRNLDAAAADALAEFAVASDTFTSDATNSKDLVYVIEIKASDLDRNNGFDCVRIGTGNAVAATVAVMYLLWAQRYQKLASPSAIVD